MSWVYLVLAVVFETAGTAFLKASNGFSALTPSVATAVSYIICFVCLSFALKTIDVSVGYAIWGACGILLVSAIGIVFFHEPVSWLKTASILLIVIGTVGVRLAK